MGFPSPCNRLGLKGNLVQPALLLPCRHGFPQSEQDLSEGTVHSKPGSELVFARILNIALVWKLPTKEIKSRDAGIRLMH